MVEKNSGRTERPVENIKCDALPPADRIHSEPREHRQPPVFTETLLTHHSQQCRPQGPDSPLLCPIPAVKFPDSAQRCPHCQYWTRHTAVRTEKQNILILLGEWRGNKGFNSQSVQLSKNFSEILQIYKLKIYNINNNNKTCFNNAVTKLHSVRTPDKPQPVSISIAAFLHSPKIVNLKNENSLWKDNPFQKQTSILFLLSTSQELLSCLVPN